MRATLERRRLESVTKRRRVLSRPRGRQPPRRPRGLRAPWWSELPAACWVQTGAVSCARRPGRRTAGQGGRRGRRRSRSPRDRAGSEPGREPKTERALGVVDQASGHVVAVLERRREDARGQSLAAALLHDLKENRLVTASHEAAGAPLHPHPPSVGLHAAFAAARARQASGSHDHVAELPACAPPVVKSPVEDQAASDPGPDPGSEHVRERTSRATRVLAENADVHIVAQRRLRAPPSACDTSGPSSTRFEKPGTFAANSTTPASASTSPGVPTPTPASSSTLAMARRATRRPSGR